MCIYMCIYMYIYIYIYMYICIYICIYIYPSDPTNDDSNEDYENDIKVFSFYLEASSCQIIVSFSLKIVFLSVVIFSHQCFFKFIVKSNYHYFYYIKVNPSSTVEPMVEATSGLKSVPITGGIYMHIYICIYIYIYIYTYMYIYS
jgi:hypothetical protein